jgi:hypothetical protein
MASRLKLQEELEQILKSENVYYNPPASVKMKYPAIVYSRSNINNDHANNEVYNQKTAYNVTVVDPDPDSDIVTAVSKLPLCRFSRHYVADNLNHDTFILYY